MKPLKLVGAMSASAIIMSSAVQAADNDNLTFSAVVQPTTCNVTLDAATVTQPGVSISHLKASGAVAANDFPGFVAEGQVFTISCGSNATMGFTVTDGNPVTDADAPTGSLGLGLGQSTGGDQDQDIGYYVLEASEWQVDDADSSGTLQSRASASLSYADESGYVLAGNTQYTLSDVVSSPAQKLSVKLTPQIYFWGTDKLDANASHNLNASYTVTAVF